MRILVVEDDRMIAAALEDTLGEEGYTVDRVNDGAGWRDAEAAVRCVTDTGPGIPADVRERVFDAFHREPVSTDVEGSGLGLSIVRAIAERHGATVTLSDGDGGIGLRVTVRLPAPKS